MSSNRSATSTGSDSMDDGDGEEQFMNPVDLDPSTTFEQLNYGTAYRGRVNNIVEYGVFVTLAGDLSGLVHVGNFPPNTSISDFSVGDPMIVEVDEKKPDKDIALNGLRAPDVETSDTGIPPSKKPGEKVFDELNALREDIEALHGINNSAEDGELQRIEAPYRDAIKTLRSCIQDGLAVEEYTTNVTDHGDSIEISLTASKDSSNE